MLTFFILLQYAGMVILLVEIMIMLLYKPSKLQRILMIMEMATLVNHAGCLLTMQAKTPETALMGIKFSYVGKPYILLAVFLFFMDYYRVNVATWFKYLLCVFHAFVSLLVLTCEQNKLFYTSMEFVEEGYFPHMVFKHGIIYNINTLVIISYFVAGFVLSFTKRKDMRTKEEKICALYLDIIAIAAVLGLVVFLTGVTGGYDTTLPSYLIGSILLFVCMIKYNILDALEVAKDMIADQIAQGILVRAPDGKIIYENQQIKQIFTKDGNYDTTRTYDMLEEYLKQDALAGIGERIYEIQKKEIRKKGIDYGRMYVVTDVTDNHNHAIELERQMVIAEMANKAKSDFLARMSHEIRTPIHAINGMDEMILRESHEVPIKRYAMNIKSAANSLLSLINDILDSSKIESGKLEIVPVEYELDSLLNDVINAVYLKAEAKGLDVNIYVDEKLSNQLYGDDVRIRQILINLLNNAVKYTHEGSITFTVKDIGDVAGTVLYFEVKDTGIGIKEEDLPKLCEAFERIEVDKNRSIEGTGLGMSIVSDLLHLMNSQLKVESVYGEGSTFSFALPQKAMSVVKIGDYKERIKNMRISDDYHCSFIAPKAKILVVDDNDINREVFCNLLKQTRIQIVDVDSGEKCIEAALSEKFDLIFLDHMMPELDGVQTLKLMKQFENYPSQDTPVIALTANAVTGAKEKYLEYGFDNYLSKPIVSEKLEQMIMEMLPENLVERISEDRVAGLDGKNLPEIDGIDWNYAHSYIQDDHVLEITLKNIYRALEPDQKQLTDLFENIYNEEGMKQYRIKVHALKSTYASVGAVMISQLAKLLEEYAIAEDIGHINEVHPIFMSKLDTIGEILRSLYAGENGDVSGTAEENVDTDDEAALEQIKEKLSQLLDALNSYDYDTADMIVEEMAAYLCEEELHRKLQLLQEQEFNLEFQKCNDTAQELLKQMNG